MAGDIGGSKTLGTWSHSRVCNVEDFVRPELLPYIHDTHPHLAAKWGQDYPRGREDRKVWEIAMAARALTELGAVHPRAEVLGVAAGREGTIFWLTTKVRRVFATDLYLDPGDWERTAQPAMLVDPAPLWPNEMNVRRIVAQHMNGLDLRYEDGSFDAVFSSSSIEHFGSLADIRRAIEEIHRVLKPGGVASIATEIRVTGCSSGFPDTRIFSHQELLDLFGGLGWDLVGPLEATFSPRTLDSVVDFAEAADDVRAGTDYRSYPHVALSFGDATWTSIHLTFRKRRRAVAAIEGALRRSRAAPALRSAMAVAPRPVRSAVDRCRGSSG
jgi:SAM-dependent methyltransferase